MMITLQCRVVLDVETMPEKEGWRQRFCRWLMEVPPNPLVWYAPNDWTKPDEEPKTTLMRPLVVVLHDDSAEPR